MKEMAVKRRWRYGWAEAEPGATVSEVSRRYGVGRSLTDFGKPVAVRGAPSTCREQVVVQWKMIQYVPISCRAGMLERRPSAGRALGARLLAILREVCGIRRSTARRAVRWH